MRGKDLNSRLGTRGNANVEFALCAIFMVFLLISIFDMARGLWIQHTLTEAVRDAARFAIVRGAGYVYPPDGGPLAGQPLPGGTLKDVRKVAIEEAVGLVPSQMELIFDISGDSGLVKRVTCNPADTLACTNGNLDDPWPAVSPGLEVAVTAHYPYNSMVVMYFPGGKGINFGKYVLGSTARERIVF